MQDTSSTVSLSSATLSDNDDSFLPGVYIVNRSGWSSRHENCNDITGVTDDFAEGYHRSLSLPEATPITAELASDTEAKLERRLQQQIIQHATPASIVPTFMPSLLTTSSAYADAQSTPVDLDDNYYQPRNVREKLFGNGRKVNFGLDDIVVAPDRFNRKQHFLPFQVRCPSSRRLTSHPWQVTVQTNQRAVESNNLLDLEQGERHLSAPTEHEDHELGQAMAVPRMEPF